MTIDSDKIQQLAKDGRTIWQIATECGVTIPAVNRVLNVPNDALEWSDEHQRTLKELHRISQLSRDILSHFEPRFITPDHTAQFIESIITMTDARKILELGMYSGYTTMHMLRAVIGKPGARVVSIDHRPAHIPEVFEPFPEFQFIEARLPEALNQLQGEKFDVIFVDSEHGVTHTAEELAYLFRLGIAQIGTILLFHDCPRSGDLYDWLYTWADAGRVRGLILPTAPQRDVTLACGGGPEYRPNLAVFMV